MTVLLPLFAVALVRYVDWPKQQHQRTLVV